ncbi:MAG: quinol oxidase [Gemmatimonadota bacterium]|nr:MAG: quinol oxidase [Gemmatimonadota bacterium]
MSWPRRLLSNDALNLDLGLLIVRLGVGLSMAILHGWGKITGGPELWAKIGGAMGNLGLAFAPAFWGFLAAFAEFGGSILLILGVFFRPAAAMLAFTMLVAAGHHLSLPAGEPGAGWNAASHALELLAVYLGLLLTGPGRHTLLRR